tara:strand:+ start:74 stop:295 length:222 start_codon:yes stop_codon:yes gene_type:complete
MTTENSTKITNTQKSIKRMKWKSVKSSLYSGYIQEYNYELNTWQNIKVCNYLNLNVKNIINNIFNRIRNLFKK